MSTKTFCLSIAFLKVFTFGAFLANSDNLFNTDGTLLQNENFLMLVQLQLTYNLSTEFLVHVVLENLKKLDTFVSSTLLMILYVTDVIVLYLCYNGNFRTLNSSCHIRWEKILVVRHIE